MHVLVTAGTKHGATSEIAEAIGRTLRNTGLDVTVAPPDDPGDVAGYDAFVVGSAVYAGRWVKDAREFVEREMASLIGKPVWLFSSGPLGDPPKPEDDPVDVAGLVEDTGARDHRLFAGKLDKARLGFAEKAIVMALRAPDGDFRRWDAIEAWASGISGALREVTQND